MASVAPDHLACVVRRYGERSNMAANVRRKMPNIRRNGERSANAPSPGPPIRGCVASIPRGPMLFPLAIRRLRRSRTVDHQDQFLSHINKGLESFRVTFRGAEVTRNHENGVKTGYRRGFMSYLACARLRERFRGAPEVAPRAGSRYGRAARRLALNDTATTWATGRQLERHRDSLGDGASSSATS